MVKLLEFGVIDGLFGILLVGLYLQKVDVDLSGFMSLWTTMEIGTIRNCNNSFSQLTFVRSRKFALLITWVSISLPGLLKNRVFLVCEVLTVCPRMIFIMGSWSLRAAGQMDAVRAGRLYGHVRDL